MTEGIYDAGRAALALAQHCKRYYERRYKVGRYGNSRSLRGCQGRKGARKAGKAYALAALVTFILGAVLVPNAYAADTNFTIYGPTAFVWDGTTYYEVGVVAANKYDAALVALGYDPANNDKFTSEVKAKLSNEGFGGAFWDFAQNFEAPPTDGGTVTQTGIQPGFWSTAYSLYGQGNVWYGKFGWVQRTQAYAAVEAVLAGNDLGGGSGSGSFTIVNFRVGSGSIYTKDGTLIYGVSDSDSSHSFAPYPIKLSTDAVDYLNNWVATSGNWWFSVADWSYNSSIDRQIATIKFYLVPSSLSCTTTYVTRSEGGRNVQYPKYRFNTGNSLAYIQCVVQYGPNTLDTYVATPDMSGSSVRTYTQNMNNSTSANWDISSRFLFHARQDSDITGDTGSDVPETNWPEPGDPVPDPDPPEVPDVPDDDPIEQPNPVNPTPPQQPTDVVGGTPPQYDPIIYPVDSTFTVDIQGILDAMAEHCRHLQAALHTLGENLSDNITNAIFDNVSWLYDMVYQQFGWIGNLIRTEGQSLRSNIYGNVGYLGDTIVDEFDSLKTYLHSLFSWLGQQMNYTVNIDKDSYDDSSVIYWLKRIWAKLGAGDINTRPTDPVADPWDIGEWLRQLWANFTADLIAMGADLLADLAMDLRDLVTKFPFSIPWDIAALLAVLAAEPVAPEIVWPWFTVGTNGSIVSTNITISLDDYDDYLGGVRTMEKLLFVGYLLFRVKDDIALLFSGGLDA